MSHRDAAAIIYVESNFLLELAFAQEELQQAERLLAAAERQQLALALPAFSLSEPLATMVQRGRARKNLSQQLVEQLQQLMRSRHLQSIREQEHLATAFSILHTVEQAESDGLDEALRRTLRAAEQISLTPDVHREALRYRSDYNLKTPDAIIYASVIADARQRALSTPKYFISRNPKDFDTPEIEAELGSLGVIYCRSFSEGLKRLHEDGVLLFQESG